MLDLHRLAHCAFAGAYASQLVCRFIQLAAVTIEHAEHLSFTIVSMTSVIQSVRYFPSF